MTFSKYSGGETRKFIIQLNDCHVIVHINSDHKVTIIDRIEREFLEEKLTHYKISPKAISQTNMTYVQFLTAYTGGTMRWSIPTELNPDAPLFIG